jgi:hypothetical protein
VGELGSTESAEKCAYNRRKRGEVKMRRPLVPYATALPQAGGERAAGDHASRFIAIGVGAAIELPSCDKRQTTTDHRGLGWPTAH